MTDEIRSTYPSLEDLNPLLRIEKLCDRFRRAWKQGDSPNLSEYLDQVHEGARDSLLRNLLPIDIEARRRRNHKPPSSEDYLKRFPTHARVIRQTFFESTMASIEQELSTPSLAATVSLVPTKQRLGDYELLDELGKGGFGVVYEARHCKRGERVALKTLPLDFDTRAGHSSVSEDRKRQHGDRLVRFKREFRTLSDLNHPNLVGLHSLEADGDQWFFTMDLIEGTDFIDFVRPAGILDVVRLRAAFTQLVSAVLALHARNIIHRDLKPSNVLVSKDGRVSVLDFGLVAELDKSIGLESIAKFAGTPAYAAPEQLDGDHSRASDWYSVGVVLYEALTGTRPFVGSGIDVLRRKQTEDPRPIEIDELTPADLAELALNLLSRDAEQRPGPLSIGHVVKDDSVVDSVSQVTTEGPLIGRDAPLLQLRDAFDCVIQDPQSQCMFVSGRSGEGKTSLVEFFLRDLRSSGECVVLSGRCYDRESVPFKAIDGIIDALTGHLQRLSDADAAMLMPDDLAFLVQLFPVLQRVPVIAQASVQSVANMDRIQVQHRGFMALKLMLKRIGGRTPIVMFADDLQWGDAESADAIAKVIRGDDAPQLLFIGTYRSDEAENSRFLQEWDVLLESLPEMPTICEINLAPLSPKECSALIAQQIGQEDEKFQCRALEIVEKTGGNPYLLTELIACYDGESDSFVHLSLPEVIERKLSRLPEDARNLLKIIAVSGKAISLEELFRCAQSESMDPGIINHMRSENLIRAVGSEQDGLVDTYHDKIRENVLSEIDELERNRIHLGIASTIEQSDQIDRDSILKSLTGLQRLPTEEKIIRRAGDLALHYESAGETKYAMAFALCAAESAISSFAFDVATQYYSIALKNADDVSSQTRYRLTSGYGKSLTQMGQYDQALHALTQASECSGDLMEASTVDLLISKIYQRRGQYNSLGADYHALLERLGISVPKSAARLVISIAAQILRKECHRVLSRGRRSTLSAMNQMRVRALFDSVYGRMPCACIGTFTRLRVSHVGRTIPECS